MTVGEVLREYYDQSVFGEDGGASQDWIQFYAGDYLVTVPNLPMRKKLITYHDLNHLITGYSNSRIGEGEVSAWELGSGMSKLHPSLFFGLFGLSTGLVKNRKRMYQAFMRGRESKSLLGVPLDELKTRDYSKLREETFHRERSNFSRLLDKPLCWACFVVSYAMYPVIVGIALGQKMFKIACRASRG